MLKSLYLGCLMFLIGTAVLANDTICLIHKTDERPIALALVIGASSGSIAFTLPNGTFVPPMANDTQFFVVVPTEGWALFWRRNTYGNTCRADIHAFHELPQLDHQDRQFFCSLTANAIFWQQNQSGFATSDTLEAFRLVAPTLQQAQHLQSIVPVYKQVSLVYHNQGQACQTLEQWQQGQSDPLIGFLDETSDAARLKGLESLSAWKNWCSHASHDHLIGRAIVSNRSITTVLLQHGATIPAGFMMLNHSDSTVTLCTWSEPAGHAIRSLHTVRMHQRKGKLWQKSLAVLKPQQKNEWLMTRSQSVTLDVMPPINVIDQNAQYTPAYTYQSLPESNFSLEKRRHQKWNQLLASGLLPIGLLDVDLKKLVGYNDFEGFKFGFGMQTNHRLSPRFGLAADAGIGLWTRKLYYGLGVAWSVLSNHSLIWNMRYGARYQAAGLKSFGATGNAIFNNETYKYFYTRQMDFVRAFESSIEWQPDEVWRLRAAYERQQNTPAYGDAFLDQGSGKEFTSLHYNELRLAGMYRFALQESGVDQAQRTSNQRDELELLVTTGHIPDIKKSYTGIELRGKRFWHAGFNHIFESEVRMGWINGGLPYSKLFIMQGSWSRFGIFAPGSFVTMKPGEFAANRYLSLHLQHQTRHPLIAFGLFKPRLSLMLQAVWGQLQDAASPQNMDVKAPSQGYVEAGIGLPELLQAGESGLGIGFYHRLSYLRADRKAENFGFKLIISIGNQHDNPSAF